jgi:hypothetical protein
MPEMVGFLGAKNASAKTHKIANKSAIFQKIFRD